MRKFLILLAMLAISVGAWAIPAHPQPATVTQPDGTQVTIKLHGDEFFNYTTTLDGYTVLRTESGAWVYAVKAGDVLAETSVLAHDAGHRGATETALLAVTPKHLIESARVNNGKLQRVRRDAGAMHTPAVDYTQFRGLIILIEFNDCAFEMSNPNAFYDHMVNDEGFTGYVDDNGRQVNCTGSVRDYFDASSMGKFKPHFDIVGPYQVNFSVNKGNQYAQAIFLAAVRAANNDVDYAQYDLDNNGAVDMVFFLCAGKSSSYSGNNSGWLWPHKSTLTDYTRYDGKYIRTYACSTEVYGFETNPETFQTEGIGTICHEFSHVLGLPDFYDADYETGGQSHHPGGWDVMAGGGSYNISRTPCAYSIFERYYMGWANPPVITAEGNYSLNALNTSNEGYMIKTPLAKEFFMLENRQKTGWDTYLPGHGMIIARVDSSNVNVWSNNAVNNKPNRNYYELLRAGNNTVDESPSDPFPGTASNMTLNNVTTPSLQTWNKTNNALSLINIRETDGVISFNVIKPENVVCVIEDFENIEPSTVTQQVDVEGKFAKWTFTKCNVNAVTEGSSTRSMAMKNPSAFMMTTPFVSDAYQVNITLRNPTSTDAKFTLSCLEGDNTNWAQARKVPNAAGTSTITVHKNETLTMSWPITLDGIQPLKLRLAMSAGNKNNPVYIDDFTIFYNNEGEATKKGDVNGDGAITGDDLNMLINILLGKLSATDASVKGNPNVDGQGGIDGNDLNALINIILGK